MAQAEGADRGREKRGGQVRVPIDKRDGECRHARIRLAARYMLTAEVPREDVLSALGVLCWERRLGTPFGNVATGFWCAALAVIKRLTCHVARVMVSTLWHCMLTRARP